MFLAILFIVLGVFALLNALGIIVGTNFWSLIWAVILLSIGFRLLRKRGNCPFCKIHDNYCNCECDDDGDCDCDCDCESEQNNEQTK